MKAGLATNLPPSLNIPDSCARCPILNDKIERWKELVDKVRAAKEVVLESERGLFIDIARRAISNSMDALDEVAEETQTRINRMTEGCRGAVTLSGESDRTGKVCDSPVYDPEPGATTSNEIVAVTRKKQKSMENLATIAASKIRSVILDLTY